METTNFDDMLRDPWSTIFKPLEYDLSNYQRWFQMYDKNHEPRLGPEPTKRQLLDAAEVLKAEGRLYWQAMVEAAGTIKGEL